MKITSHQLEAFFETARTRSFTGAADNLGLTQSALSQRISKLEDDLEVTLFIREPSGVQLTSAGEILLRHCQITSSLEEQVLSQMKSTSQEVIGSIRIAGFSSVTRSVLIPSLAPFLRANPKVNCEFRSYEMVDLFEILRSAKADLVILDYHLNKTGIEEMVIGQEEYVVIESSQFATDSDHYLDQGPHDNATESFFQAQERSPKKLRRSFMGDVYGIINGVELGLGRAVMSKHLLKRKKSLRILKGFKRYLRDVTLHYYRQPYYSRLHQEIIKQLSENASQYLS